jgi:hypothetical protein
MAAEFRALLEQVDPRELPAIAAMIRSIVEIGLRKRSSTSAREYRPVFSPGILLGLPFATSPRSCAASYSSARRRLPVVAHLGTDDPRANCTRWVVLRVRVSTARGLGAGLTPCSPDEAGAPTAPRPILQ